MDELLRADITKVEPAVRDVMLSGRINALMPLSCMKDEEGITGVYSTENMIPVREGRFSAKSVLELTGRILRMTEELPSTISGRARRSDGPCASGANRPRRSALSPSPS